MKWLLLLCGCIASLSLFSQKKVQHSEFWNDQRLLNQTFANEIDPRQYVKVLYKKNPNYKPIDRAEMQRIIWNWNDTGYFQKFKVLDNNGMLNIFFDKNALAKNTKFQGNISLEAHLKGKEGERKIEVGPYSLVGVERKEIGIESFTPTTVAQLLFNTILEMKRTVVLSKDLRTIDFSKSNLAEDSSTLARIARMVKNIKTTDTLDLNRPYVEELYRLVGKYVSYTKRNGKEVVYDFFNSLHAVLSNSSSQYGDLRDAIDVALAGIRNELEKNANSQAIAAYPLYKILVGKLDLINEYLNSFENAGPDAVKAFLTLAAKDKINFHQLKQTLSLQAITLKNKVNAINPDSKDLNNLLGKEIGSLVKEIIQTLNEFSAIESSDMYRLIRYFDNGSNPDALQILKELEDTYGIQFKETASENKMYDSVVFTRSLEAYGHLHNFSQSPVLTDFKDSLSKLAAEIIYRKLVYATIDLGKSGAQPGDILYLYVVWKNIDGERDSTSKSSSLLPIGKYYMRETGWKTEISESFYLVERINEPSDGFTSKSNFKGAYGASIMRTFYYNENYERAFIGRVLNRVQPSLGFNISYVDFYTNKDIEIGAGLQLGLFKNVFFFGSGINLHGIRKEEKKSAAYFMFGVSFTNIAAKFKGNGGGAQE